MIAAGLTRCEALLERPADSANPIDEVRAMATLGDTIAKLRAASRTMMPEADRLAIETSTVKGFSEMLCRLSPALAPQVIAAVEAYARGQR